jgi:hypothetical protein
LEEIIMIMDPSDFEWLDEDENKGEFTEETEETKELCWSSSDEEPEIKMERSGKSHRLAAQIELIVSKILSDMAEERIPSVSLPTK